MSVLERMVENVMDTKKCSREVAIAAVKRELAKEAKRIAMKANEDKALKEKKESEA